MAWQRLTVVVPGPLAEPIADALGDAGAISTDLTDADAGSPEEQAVFGEPGALAAPWPHARLTALFPVHADVAPLFRAACLQAGLAPPIGDPLRGPYLRWMAFYGSCFEPALIDKAQKREPATPSMSPYSDYDTMLKTLTDQLGRGSYLLGERFSAADVLWGTALSWTVMFGLVPELPVIQGYVARVNARPAVLRARAKDAELAKSLA